MKHEQREIILRDIIIIIAAGAVYLIVSNFGLIMKFFSTLFGATKPLLYGVFSALVLNVPLSRIEKRLDGWKKREGKNNRILATLITYLLFFLIIAITVVIIVPQLISSLSTLANNMSSYLVSLAEMFNELMEKIGFDYEIPIESIKNGDIGTAIMALLNNYFEKIRSALSDIVPGFIGDLTSVIGSVLGYLVTVMLSIIFSVHILLSKEKLLRQINNVMNAFLSPKAIEYIRYVFGRANDIFSDFIGGTLVEMGILGVIFFVCMTVLRMPYAFLISVVIALSSIIPYFGSTAGIIFGAILILADQGFVQMVVFIAVFLVLQQIEDNIIYPRVVGGSVGLEPIWVLFSLLFFGKLFGVFGMVASPPLMALIYSLFSEIVHWRNREKNAAKE